MEYIKTAQTTELTPGNKMKVMAGGKAILLVNLDGAYYAISNTCPHLGGSLVDGRLEGNRIICPRHGSTFDVTTGKAIHGGKLMLISFHVKDTVSYPVKVEGTDIFVGV